MRITGRLSKWLVVVAVLAAAPTAVSAKTLAGTTTARLRVETACRLYTAPLSFGAANLFSGQIDTTATLRLSCGPAVAYTVAIDNGQNFNGQRRMYGGSFLGFPLYVSYEIYRNAARTQVWGAAAANVVSGITPANGDVTLTAYGRVPNSMVLARRYVDTVTVTVNF